MKKGVIICAILDLLAFTCLFLAYGPISYFRNLLITTAMTTKSHHYLAYTLYSKATIEKVLASNYIITQMTILIFLKVIKQLTIQFMKNKY